MRTTSLICFLLFTTFLFANEDRKIIDKIDKMNGSAMEYYKKNKIVKSVNLFLEAKHLADSINDYYGFAIANYNLGKIHSKIENKSDAKAYFLRTLDASKKVDNDILIAKTYIQLANISKAEEATEEANEYLEKAIEYSEIKNYHTEVDKDKLNFLSIAAGTYLCDLLVDTDQLEKGLINLLKVKKLLEVNTPNLRTKGFFKYIYANYFFKKGLYNAAKANYEEAIALVEGDKHKINVELLSKVFKNASLNYYKVEEPEKAYAALLKYDTYKSQFLNTTKLEHDNIIKSKYLLEDYKSDAEKANIERLQQVEVANRLKRGNNVAILMLVLLLVSIIIISYGYLTKRRLSKALRARNTELEITKNEALKSSELKSKFISNVTHELRTPLYGVVGITSILLQNNDLKEQDRKHLNSLKYSGDYLLNLINDILQIGQIEANKVKLKKTSVNLEQLFKNIINSFESRLNETNNNIRLTIDEEVPKHIKCDKVRLSQIIFNLAGNSIKFTYNGTIDLRIKLLDVKGRRANLTFEVEDNGAGIPKSKFKTIFDNFSQLEDSNVNYQGTGLGLAITKNLINLFGSKIHIESEIGKGTKFSFTINFEIDSSAHIEKRVKQEEARHLIETNKNYKILIVEDNKINQIVTKSLLEKQDYQCVVVQNGKEALEEVRANKYDLVLMDINMPIMNGNEATEIIRSFNTTLPIIALTAADIEEVKDNYLEIGYNDIIIKPFDNYEFFQTINTQIQKSQLSSGVDFTKAS